MITLGSVDVKGIRFSYPGRPDNDIICGLDEMDGLEFMTQYPNSVRATGVELGDTYGLFFCVWVADCFSPPLAIVRAQTESDAEDAFVDALDWAHLKEPELSDYDPDNINHGPRGQPYDSSEVHVMAVKLLGVIV